MMTKSIAVCVLALLATSVAAGSAFTDLTAAAPQGPLSHLGFLDASRLSIRNSLFFGYSSDGATQRGGGAFMTSLGYAVSPRLAVRATLAKEFTFLGRGPSDEGISLSGLDLEWTPSKNLFVHIAFSSPPAYSLRDPHALTWR